MNALAIFALVLAIGCKGGNKSKESSQNESNQNASQDNPNQPKDMATMVEGGTNGNNTTSSSPSSGLTAPSASSNPGGMGSLKTGSASPRSMSEVRYTPPPADESTTATSYTSPGGSKVELVGVAKITEDSIQCWGPDGDRDSNLESKIKESFTSNRYGGSGGNISIAYGKKNRVLIFKTTRRASMSSSGMNDYVDISSVGDGMGGGGYASIHLNEGQSSMNNGTYSNYTVRSVSVPNDQKSTTARLMVNSTLAQTTNLNIQKGASCSLGGLTAKITSIGPYKAPKNSNMMMDMSSGMGSARANRKLWQVEIDMSGSGKGRLHFSATSNGQPMYVDQSGNIIDQQKADEMRRQLFKDGHPTPEAYAKMPQPISFGPTGYSSMMIARPGESSRPMGSNKQVYVMNVNPKFLSSVRVMCSQTKTVELKRIPLH